MSEVLLFTVDDVFQLSGRLGLVLVPGIPDLPGMPVVHIGSPIILSIPDGKRINTEVAGFEMLKFGGRSRPAILSTPLALPAGISKQDVPWGTKVFLVISGASNTGA
ncbi:hypothetical protein [Xanthomonas sp. LMG 12461]|uniref:hypothetical protein n=1 Tax=Xanthomonas sp. LMG 12461 TaxID=2014543 RepID=UPI0012644C8D|nr:hypothetical protein [Xanthomonas sp. LMG 12461]